MNGLLQFVGRADRNRVEGWFGHIAGPIAIPDIDATIAAVVDQLPGSARHIGHPVLIRIVGARIVMNLHFGCITAGIERQGDIGIRRDGGAIVDRNQPFRRDGVGAGGEADRAKDATGVTFGIVGGEPVVVGRPHNNRRVGIDAGGWSLRFQHFTWAIGVSGAPDKEVGMVGINLKEEQVAIDMGRLVVLVIDAAGIERIGTGHCVITWIQRVAAIADFGAVILPAFVGVRGGGVGAVVILIKLGEAIEISVVALVVVI